MASMTSLPSNDTEEPIYYFSASDAKELIKKTGSYVKEDTSAGRRVSEFINSKKLPLKTPNGLDFCAENSFYDKAVRDVIESSIDQPHLGLAKLYDSTVLPSDTAYFFIQGPEVQAMYILLFTPETRFLLFEGSHERKLPGKIMSNFGLLTLTHDKLRVEGIMDVQHDITNGGFALIDGRVGWTILKGQAFAIGYASKTEIGFWGQIELGDTAPLREKVAELNDKGIKAKFIFVKPRGTIPVT